MINKQSFCLTVFFLLVLGTVSVSAEEVFNDWVNVEKDFEVEGETFKAYYYEQNDKVSLLGSEFTLLIEQGDCKTKNQYTICFNLEDSGRAIYEDGKELTAVKLSFATKSASVAVSQKSEESSLQLNERMAITATITNSGDEMASWVIFDAEIPSELKLSGQNTAGQMVHWEGPLKIDETKTIKYYVEAEEVAEYEITAKVRFDVDGKEKIIEAKTLELGVAKPYDVEVTLSTKVPELDEEVQYDVVIENEEDKTVDYSIDITIPRYISVKKFDKITKQEDDFYETGTLKKGEKKEFSLVFTVLKEGTYTLPLKLEISDFEETIETDIRAGSAKLLPELIVEPTTVIADQEFTIEMTLENLGEKDAEKIAGIIKSDAFKNYNFKEDEIAPGKKAKFEKRTFTARNIQKEETFPISIEGNFESGGKEFTFTAKSEITIVPKELLFELSLEHDKEKGVPGKEFEFNVYVKNLKSSTIENIDIVSTIPLGWKVVEGEYIGNIASLGPLKKEKAYTFTLMVPSDFKETTGVTTTSVNTKFQESLYKQEKVEKFFIAQDGVEPKEVVSEDDKDVETTDDESKNEVETTENKETEVKEEGFVRKVFGFLFGWLLR